MFMPREKSRTAWKTAQGPATSMNSAPPDMTKATRILPWAGGTSLVAGFADEIGCWPKAVSADAKVSKTIDSIISLFRIKAPNSVLDPSSDPWLHQLEAGVSAVCRPLGLIHHDKTTTISAITRKSVTPIERSQLLSGNVGSLTCWS